MGTGLESEYYDTLGGFLYDKLDKIPVAGDTITFEGLTYTVLATRGRRITKVSVVRSQPQESPPPANQQEEDHKSLMLPPPDNENNRHAEEPSHHEIRGA